MSVSSWLISQVVPQSVHSRSTVQSALSIVSHFVAGKWQTGQAHQTWISISLYLLGVIEPFAYIVSLSL